MNKNNK